MIVFRQGVTVALRPDGSVRITEPGFADVVHAPGSTAALDYREIIERSNLQHVSTVGKD